MPPSTANLPHGFGKAKTISTSPPTAAPTFAPSPKLTPSPPLPTLASTCIANQCQTAFTTCMATFDACACIPGQLACALANCTSDYSSAVTTCGTMVAKATSCVLVCAAAEYPSTTNTANTVMQVVATIAIQGVSAAQFTSTQQTGFKTAVASTISGVTASQVNITAMTDVADGTRRLEELKLSADGEIKSRRLKQAAGTHLKIDFTILVTSPAALQSTAAALQAQSGSIGTPSALATALVSSGVVTDASSVQVQSVKTQVSTPVVVTPAPTLAPATTATPPTTVVPTPGPTEAPSKPPVVGIAVGVAVAVLILLVSGYYFYRKRSSLKAQ